VSAMSGMRDVLSRIPAPWHRSATATPFVALDRSRCEACWCCVAACPEAVLGKVEFFHHKHAVVEAGERCTGCGKCVKACRSGALSGVDG
jgi:ferredoxin